jgi:alkaline phosphatase D
MKKKYAIILLLVIMLLLTKSNSFAQSNNFIPPCHKVTLPQAHVGDLTIDTKLLDSYKLLPENVREFYLQSRAVFAGNPEANFTDKEIVEAAKNQNIGLMGGPLLGQLAAESVTLWFRPATKNSLEIVLSPVDATTRKTYKVKRVLPGVEQRVLLDGLLPATQYNYSITSKNEELAKGSFATAPLADSKEDFRITFGSCFHKIGLHNPNLVNQILKRKPNAMMLLGDLAVDDRENQINMHRSDYLLRDVSKAWSDLAAHIPLYSAWDDHDYFNNDLSGIPKAFTAEDRDNVRAVWFQNWNNPVLENEGIYFNTRIGPVEIIMLDTRSCREGSRRGEYGSYLGLEQMLWLKDVLKESDAPFKIISSGTMWSDYMSKAKDSWGSWDIKAREEIFGFIEDEKISGVLLISGDRHGGRGFTIPRESGFKFYEFEAATMGGVPGPNAMAPDITNQLFGYHGTDAIAFAEFTFTTSGSSPVVTFRLIDEKGQIMEEHILPYKKLVPKQ